MGNEVDLFAADYGLVVLSPVKQLARPVEEGVLGWRTPLASEFIDAVARESAGEVAPHITVGYFFSSVHENLGAIVELWRTIHCKQQCIGLFQGGRIATVFKEAVGVVVFDEGHNT